METVTRFVFLVSQITEDGDCSHKIKRHLLLGRKTITNLDSIFKSRDITLATMVCIDKAMVFPVGMYLCENWTIKKAAAVKSLQSCWTLCDPIDGSPTGSPIPGILQARTLEWVAVSLSNVWKWKVKVKLFSRVWLLVPSTAAYQASPYIGSSRQEYWSGVSLPSWKEGWASRNWYFEMWCCRRLLKVPWSARSNQRILKKSVLNIHWKDWCWSWSSNALVTWWEKLTHWKHPWCWERWRQEEKGMIEDVIFGRLHWLNGQFEPDLRSWW